jgi:beta-lactamase class A
MKTMMVVLLASMTALHGSPALAHQPSAANASPESATAFDRRAAELVDVINGYMAFDAYFAPSFQAAVPEAQFKTMTAGIIAQYGRAIAAEGAHSADGHSGTLKLRFEKGVATVLLDAGGAPDERVTGLRITGFTVADDSFARISGEIAALPGTTGFLVAEVDGDSFRPIAAAHADRQFAVGSSFKL